MFIHNINPVFFSIGNLDIRYYGLVYALGFLFMYWFLWREIKKGRFNITTDQLDTLLIYLILGVIVGARIGEFIFFQPQVFLANPLELFYIWHGGMAFHGGIIGVIIALWLYWKKYNIPMYEITDRVVMPLSMILVFGRIANFINAELVGTITNKPWAVNFNGELDLAGNRVFRHPSQLYEGFKNLLTYFGLYIVSARQVLFGKMYKRGYLSWLFVLFYGVGRAITDIWRDDGHWLFGVLSTGQLLSIVMALVALYFLVQFYWKQNQYKEQATKIHRSTRHKKKSKNK